MDRWFSLPVLVAAAVVLVVVVWLTGDEEPTREVDHRPGLEAVYDRIESERDCTALQDEFDRAIDNAERQEPGSQARAVSRSYAEAADDRMDEVGCYD